MKLRWATRLAAVILVGLAWALVTLRMGQLDWIYNGEPRPVVRAAPDPNPIPLPSDPEVNPPIMPAASNEGAEEAPDIKHAGRLPSYLLAESLGFEFGFFGLAHVTALLLLIASFFLPRRRPRTTPFQTPA